MAAVWAFCVGVQAEDVDCLPSPRSPVRTLPFPPSLPHTLLMGELLLWGGVIPEEFML